MIPVKPGESALESKAMLQQARAWLAQLSTDDLSTLAGTTKKMSALASVAARVGLAEEVEMDYAQAAREAERRLGQLLDEGRKDGSVATGKEGRAGTDLHVDSLGKLGIQHQLAADAAAFARLADTDWHAIVSAGRKQSVLARSGMRRAADARLAELQGAIEYAQERRKEAARLERERAEIIRELEKAARAPIVEIEVEADLVLRLPNDPQKAAETLMPRRGDSSEDLREIGVFIQRLTAIKETLLKQKNSFPKLGTEVDAMFCSAARSALSAIVAAAHAIGAQVNAREQTPKIRRVK
jgi:hypothetical protein